MTIGIITAELEHESQNGHPRCLTQVAGLSLLERQLRQLHRLGLSSVRIVSARFPEDLHQALSGFRLIPSDTRVLDSKVLPEDAFPGDQDLLFVDDSVVIDERILKLMLSSDSDSFALFDPRSVVPGLGDGTLLPIDGDYRLFASAARVQQSTLATAFAQSGASVTAEGLFAAAPHPQAVAISDLDLYIPDRRRIVPLLWRPIARDSDIPRAAKDIIAQAQKGTLDWPARFVHPPFENAVTLALAPTPITPNMVTLFTGIFGFVMTWLFATGQPGWALAGALVLGVLDGVDGKLARTTLTISKVGELEHLLDKLVEYSWYLGLAWWLSAVVGHQTPWVLAIMLILFAWAEVVQGEFFRRLTLKQLDDTGPFERAFRLIGGRRNTQMWALVPFGLYGEWMLGLWVISIYAAVTFFVAQWRFIVQLMAYARHSGAQMGKNLDETAYF